MAEPKTATGRQRKADTADGDGETERSDGKDSGRNGKEPVCWMLEGRRRQGEDT